jgi:hypothetical protein
MARNVQSSKDRTLYQCVEPFAVFRGGIPEVYGADRMVLAGDPILLSHPAHFRLAADRVEAMTASPGEMRPVSIPIPPEAQPVVVTTTIPEETPDV